MKRGNEKVKANAGNALSAFKLHLNMAGDLSQMTAGQRKAALAKLAHQLNSSHAGDQKMWKKFSHDIVPRLWEKGKILLAIKEALPGQFELWSEEHLDFGLRCAQIYTRLAKEMPEKEARNFQGSLRDAKKYLGWLPESTSKKATKPKSNEANHGSSRGQDETQAEADAKTEATANDEASSTENDSQTQAETRTEAEAQHDDQTESETQASNESEAGTKTESPAGLQLLRSEADLLLSNLRAAGMAALAASSEERRELRDVLTHIESACGALRQELRHGAADETTGETEKIVAAAHAFGSPKPVVRRGQPAEPKPEETPAESDEAASEPKPEPGRASAKWQLMNWRLNNRHLAAIWGLKVCTVRTRRWRKGHGPAQSGAPEAYQKALEAEKVKAKSFE